MHSTNYKWRSQIEIYIWQLLKHPLLKWVILNLLKHNKASVVIKVKKEYQMQRIGSKWNANYLKKAFLQVRLQQLTRIDNQIWITKNWHSKTTSILKKWSMIYLKCREVQLVRKMMTIMSRSQLILQILWAPLNSVCVTIYRYRMMLS